MRISSMDDVHAARKARVKLYGPSDSPYDDETPDGRDQHGFDRTTVNAGTRQRAYQPGRYARAASLVVKYGTRAQRAVFHYGALERSKRNSSLFFESWSEYAIEECERLIDWMFDTWAHPA